MTPRRKQRRKGQDPWVSSSSITECLQPQSCAGFAQATCCELMSAVVCPGQETVSHSPPPHHLTLPFRLGNLPRRKVLFCSVFQDGAAVSAEHLVKPGAGEIEGAGTRGDKCSEQWSFRATLSRWLMPPQEKENSPTPKMEAIYSRWSHLHKSNTSHSTHWQLTRQEGPAWDLVGTNHIQMITTVTYKNLQKHQQKYTFFAKNS